MTTTAAATYPHDETTRALVACALAVADTMEQRPGIAGDMPALQLLTAARKWRQARTGSGTKRG